MMRNMLWALFGLTVGYVAGQYDALGGDYVVTRGTTIESERPIGLLIAEAGLGVLNGRDERDGSGTALGALEGASIASTRLAVDGREQPGRTSVLAAWRLIGFLVWDADGSVERCTTAIVRGHPVRIRDAVSNGRVAVEVVVGPPLGDPRVRCAVLTLTAVEVGNANSERSCGRGLAWLGAGTRIQLSCSAIIDLPGDRCRLVRRLATRIADRDAGPELRSRVDGLAVAGREEVLAGRGRLTDSVIVRFINEVCKPRSPVRR